MESIDELKDGLETKKGEVKKMENDLVGKGYISTNIVQCILSF